MYQHALGLFLFGLLRAAALAEHFGSIGTLFDELLEDLLLGRIVELFHGVHLLLLQRGFDHANCVQPHFVLGLHGGDHVRLHPFE